MWETFANIADDRGETVASVKENNESNYEMQSRMRK